VAYRIETGPRVLDQIRTLPDDVVPKLAGGLFVDLEEPDVRDDLRGGGADW
jgi:hypothetical protein